MNITNIPDEEVKSLPMADYRGSDNTKDGIMTDKDVVMYTEGYVKARVRRGVIRTSTIALLLIFMMSMVLGFHARSRGGGGKVFEAVSEDYTFSQHTNEEDRGTTDMIVGGADDGKGSRNLQSCYEFTQVVADRDLYEAAYRCLNLIFGVGCSSGDFDFVDYYQIIYGGNWYVYCRCDC